MLNAIETGFSSAIGFVGDVVEAITSTSGEFAGILPVIGLVIGMGVVGFAIRKVKSLVWGL